MTYCVNCGTPVDDMATFCPKCGFSLQSVPVAPAAPVEEQPADFQPAYYQPGYQQAAYQPPVEAQPVAQQPVYQQPVYQQPVYQQPVAPVAYANRPADPLSTSRGMIKFILLSIVTCGIYGLIAMACISRDINTIAGKYDGKSTMNFVVVALVFSWLTCGIVPIIWYHKISSRIGDELDRRGIDYGFGAGTFWCWNVLGSMIYVGPLIYLHKLMKAMNKLSDHYNNYG